MERCYEYLGCAKKDCVMQRLKPAVPCWEIEETLCNHAGIELVRLETAGRKEEACRRCGCIYYRAASRQGKVSAD